jgi:hypothetical protein
MTKIFVSIACFMDKDILNTIENCLEKAKNPENIVFGICLQGDPKDNYLEKYEYHPQCRIHKMHWNEARGPAYARGIIYDMFQEEDYFFQIDCHTRFFQDWDEKIIHCFHECKKLNEKAIISHYPVNINNMFGKNFQQTIINISTVRCVDSRMGIKTHGRNVNLNLCPKKSWGISAAMLFFDKQAYNEIVFDKEIYFGLQFEEQVVLSARYWTHGYDIFTPSQHIIGTEYITNRKRQRHSVPRKHNLHKESYSRLCHIMKLKYDKRYINSFDSKLGTVRSIEDYYKMLNIYDRVEKVFTNNYLDNLETNVDQKTNNISLEITPKTKSSTIPIVVIENGGNSKLIPNLTNLNIDFVSFPVTEINYQQMIDSKQINIERYKLRYNQVALWQSHYTIWQKMVEDNISKLLIFENTCQLVPNFKELFNNVLNFEGLLEYDILYLGYSGTNVISDKKLHLLDTGCPRCTHSYILTISGAKKLLNNLKTIDYPFDELMGGMFNRKELTGYRTSKLLTYQAFQLKNVKYNLQQL